MDQAPTSLYFSFFVIIRTQMVFLLYLVWSFIMGRFFLYLSLHVSSPSGGMVSSKIAAFRFVFSCPLSYAMISNMLLE